MPVLQGGTYTAELVSDVDLTGATVTCQVTAPDGTSSTPTADVSGKTATAVIPATQVGTWLIVWSITGTTTGVAQDQFSCEAPRPDLISLPDLKEELNFDPTSTAKDAKLRRWMRAAAEVVENVTGPIRPHTQTDWFDGGDTTVVLSTRWASSITTVTETGFGGTQLLTEQVYGGPMTGYGYTWDRETNILIRRTSNGAATRFAGGLRSVQVVYQAGLATIPDDVQLATAELIRHWYRKNEVSGRTASAYGGSGNDDTVMVGNYMVPNSVMELLGPWRRPPGLA